MISQFCFLGFFIVLCMHLNITDSVCSLFQHLKRAGWVLCKIQEPETIAGHMYRMAMLSFLVDSQDNLDKAKYGLFINR